MFFNTLVPFEDGLIKYGVMSRRAFLADALDWRHLYVAGRLHKPVKLLEMDAQREWEITMSLRLNLQSALHAALLLTPENFAEEELYRALAGLSYQGDFRMTVGEDKNKVANIVRPNVLRFRALYSGRLRALSDLVEMSHSGRGEQDSSSAARHFHLTQLPRELQWGLALEWNRDGRYRDVEDVLRAAAYDRDSDEMIRRYGALYSGREPPANIIFLRALQRIVSRSSVNQAAKGVLTAGPAKTVRYSWAKLAKMIKSLKQS